MKYSTLNADQLHRMLLAGATVLKQHKQEINSLNVFPVPDGDTGTNMNLTMEAAAKEMAKKPLHAIKDVAEALATGSLMGARGNSGVILSQIYRGFAKRIGTEAEITPAIFAAALQEGVNTAYKAVIKPVEGTILTVSKRAAREATRSVKESADIAALMTRVLREALITLEETPDMLPVLKQAGVVDAGGKGLCYIFEGWLSFLEGKEVTIIEWQSVSDGGQGHEQQESIDLEFNYCTELIVTGDGLHEDVFRRQLSGLGDSLLVVGTTGLIKIHIHTNNPGTVLEFALSQGKELQDIKIENMRLQHTEVLAQNQQASVKAHKHTAVIAVTAGSGLEEIFRSMGVDVVIAGGQTMNPSTEAFIKAIGEVNATQVVILPNNSNIIMAAKQAADVSELPVAVVPTKTIPQGLAAMLNYSEESGLEQLTEAMIKGSETVKSGQVTFAVRDSVFDGKPIAEGNILGIADGKIVAVGEDMQETALNLVSQMLTGDSEIITLFYGEDISHEEATSLSDVLSEAHPEVEIELHSGGQPLYFYIIAVE